MRDPAAYDAKIADIAGRLTPASRVLEIGAGTGTTAVRLAPHAGSIDALDISAEMIRIARERAADAGVTNITFHHGALEDAGLTPGYDMALAMSLLHLLPDRPATLAHLHGLLKPGGVFISSSFCFAEGFVPLLPIVLAGRALGVFPAVQILRQRQLLAEITAAGFHITRVGHPRPRAAVFVIAERR
jgi:2-polyprenyl-3-methyl-5-hydroxy-6-metoxy-1,4-benzoquinol methylase